MDEHSAYDGDCCLFAECLSNDGQLVMGVGIGGYYCFHGIRQRRLGGWEKLMGAP